MTRERQPDACLLADAYIALTGTVIRTVRNRNRKFRERRHRSGLPYSQLLALQPADAGNEGQMVIVTAFRVAFLLPSAYLTVWVRFGVGFAVVACSVDGGVKPGFNMPIIGRVIKDPISFGHKCFPGWNYIHKFRQNTLCAFDQMGIEIAGELSLLLFHGPACSRRAHRTKHPTHSEMPPSAGRPPFQTNRLH